MGQRQVVVMSVQVVELNFGGCRSPQAVESEGLLVAWGNEFVVGFSLDDGTEVSPGNLLQHSHLLGELLLHHFN